MILKNYYTALRTLVTGLQIYCTHTDGYGYNLFPEDAYSVLRICDALSAVSNSTNGSAIVVGSGTTPPIVTDYKLESQITTVSGSASYKRVSAANSDTFTAVATITNTGTEPITISEVGLQLKATNNSNYMVERTLLESPITIPAGGTGNVTYTICVNYPI